MDIEIPQDLNAKEIKCFTEIVKEQLQELYSYEYDTFTINGVKICVAKEKFPLDVPKPSKEIIQSIISKIPKKDLGLLSQIYFVSYHCKNNKEINGRTLPLVYKILIYPKAIHRLQVILTHEIGHVVFERGLPQESKQHFALVLLETFPAARFSSPAEYAFFIKEQFADSYENFINNPMRLKKFPLLHHFFTKYI